MPASANIAEYNIKKNSYPNQAKYFPSPNPTLPLTSSIMENNYSPLQNPTNTDFSNDNSILPSPPNSSQETFGSDFSKLDTLAAAAGSILVSLANFSQPASTDQNSDNTQPEKSGTWNEPSSKKEDSQCTPHADNLADLAAAAVSSLSNMTPSEPEFASQKQKLENPNIPTVSSGYKRGSFMSISALLDENPLQSSENRSEVYSPLQNFKNSQENAPLSRRRSDGVDTVTETYPVNYGTPSNKRLISEPELSMNKRHSPSRFDSLLNNPSTTNTGSGYTNALVSDKSISLPRPDGSYSNVNRYHSSNQLSNTSAMGSAPSPQYKSVAHGLTSDLPNNSVAGYRGSQPSYQPLKTEGPNAFSKKYQSMQDPKIKRNATHAYIAYMIYTDRLQSKDSETKKEPALTLKPGNVGASTDPSLPSKLPLNHYGHSAHSHTHNHPYSYPHSHGHPQHTHPPHQHAHLTHNHPPQHNHTPHQHHPHPHQHQRPHAHQHPHAHAHQHLYHHHHPQDQRSQSHQSTPQPPYTGNTHVDSRYSQPSVVPQSNQSRYESREHTSSPYYSPYERSSGPSHVQTSRSDMASSPPSTTNTAPGYSPDRSYGAPYRRENSSPNGYVSGGYSSASSIPPPVYSPNMRMSQSGNYSTQSPQITSRTPIDGQYSQKSKVTPSTWQPDPSSYTHHGRAHYRT
ncbi:hypothetical protein K7432_012120 [Basidiobolus ranarum]|uniref:Uncharacterized protein n=1 Tax=Basidiobolus ranarum TaxID=34480 RepID=A0ABR2WLC0_9FUNG